jgi:REP element-mobilizing transposase RayT
MDIFRDEEDFKVFLFRLKENLFPELIKKKDFPKSAYRRKTLPFNSFDLIAYCLMPNHFHLLIKQNSDVSISVLMLKLCSGFSKYFNKKYDRVGSLFQDQFKAVLINKNEQLLWTSLYIHENPLKAEIVNDLSKYKWSSYLDYIGLQNNNICKKEIILEQFNLQKHI